MKLSDTYDKYLELVDGMSVAELEEFMAMISTFIQRKKSKFRQETKISKADKTEIMTYTGNIARGFF